MEANLDSIMSTTLEYVIPKAKMVLRG